MPRSTLRSSHAQIQPQSTHVPRVYLRDESNRNSQPNTELILIRGLPGSGKSTMAKVLALAGYRHFEADMFFFSDGLYTYDASRIRDAHAWCQKMSSDSLRKGERVVVSNTFTRLLEMAPYRSMTENIRVIEAGGNWTNTHGVPEEMIERMAARWEHLPVQCV